MKSLTINFCLISLLVAMSGCATTTRLPPQIIEKVVTVEVEIPIVKPCIKEDVPLPDLLIGTLTDADKKDPGKVVTFYVADVVLLKSVIEKQRNLMSKCKIEDEPEVKTDTPIPNGNPPPTTGKKFAPPPPVQ